MAINKTLKEPEVPTPLDLTPQSPVKEASEKRKKDLKYMRDKDREMVKGIFRFYECPGAVLPFVFRCYKEDGVERFDLQDGNIYTVPLGVAKHLNKNGWYPIHSYLKDEDGNVSMKIGQKVRRFGFQSLEFVDIADLTPTGSPLVTAELTSI
jgi:hypothetical protein